MFMKVEEGERDRMLINLLHKADQPLAGISGIRRARLLQSRGFIYSIKKGGVGTCCVSHPSPTFPPRLTLCRITTQSASAPEVGAAQDVCFSLLRKATRRVNVLISVEGYVCMTQSKAPSSFILSCWSFSASGHNSTSDGQDRF